LVEKDGVVAGAGLGGQSSQEAVSQVARNYFDKERNTVAEIEFSGDVNRR